MHVKTSKEVTDRQKACGFVLSVLELQGPSVSDALSERFDPSTIEGEGPPAYLSVITTFADSVKAAIDRLVAADEVHYAVKAKHTALIKRRNRLVKQAGKRLSGLRQTLVGQHDEPDLGQLGFEDETAREAVPLSRQLTRVVEVFADPELDSLLGEPLFETKFEPAGYALQLKSDATELLALLSRLDTSQRRVEDAYLRKQAVQEEYDQLFLRTARIFEDYCRLAGRGALAERIRPSVKRPGRTETEPPGDTDPPAEEPMAEEPVAEEPVAEPQGV